MAEGGARSLPDLVSKLKIDSSDLGKAAAEAEGLGGKIRTVITAGVGVAAAAIAGFGAISLHNFLEAGNAAETMSKSFGISTHSASAWTEAAAMMNVSRETLTTGFTVLTRTMGNMDLQMDASGKAGKLQTEIFKELGIKIKDAHGNLRPLTDVMGDVADRFSRTTDSGEKLTIAMKLFGKSAGPELIPFLDQGRSGINALMSRAQAMGAVLGEEDVAASHKLELQMATWHVVMTGITNTMARALIPLALEFATWVSTRVMPALTAWSHWFIAEAEPRIRTFVATIEGFLRPKVEGVVTWVKDHWPEISDTIKGTMADVKTVLEDVVTDVGNLAGAIAGLQGNSSALQTTMGGVTSSLKFLHEHTRLVATAIEIMTVAYIAANVVSGIHSAITTVGAALDAIAAARKGALAAATWIATAAQAAWNAVMAINPIGLLIIGVALLIGGLVLLFTHLSTVHAWFKRVWDTVSNNPIGWLVNTIIAMLISAVRNNLQPALETAAAVFAALWQWAQMVGDIFGTVARKVGDLVGAISRLPGISQLGGLVNAVSHIAGSGIIGRQHGGSLIPGNVYRIGETQPETVVMGAAGGYVIPDGGAGAGRGGPQVVQNFYQANPDPWTVSREVAWVIRR